MRSQGAIPATAHCSYMALPMDLAALLSSATVRERSSAAILCAFPLTASAPTNECIVSCTGTAISATPSASSPSQAHQSPTPIGGGAAAKRGIWCQIFADVLKRPVIMLPDDETETLGDAIIAAQAGGIKEIPYDFGKGKLIEPCRRNAAIYDRGFARYKELYSRLKDMLSKQ